jgi:hypothetical protein
MMQHLLVQCSLYCDLTVRSFIFWGAGSFIRKELFMQGVLLHVLSPDLCCVHVFCLQLL